MKMLLRKGLRFFCKTIPVRGRHRLADKLGYLIAPAGEEVMEVSGMNIPIDHSIRMYRYIYYGIYEEHFLRLLNRVVKKGDVVIEPGMNIGYITALLSGLVGDNGKVIALEPSRICFSKVQVYLTAPNIILLNKALVDTERNVSFTDKPIVIRHGYSAISDLTTVDKNDDVYDISGTSVDSLMDSCRVGHVRLLKLDIEGSELMALKGAEKALMRRAIDYILVESLFDQASKEVNTSISDLLFRNGYRPFLMGRDRLLPVRLSALSGKRLDLIWSHLDS